MKVDLEHTELAGTLSALRAVMDRAPDVLPAPLRSAEAKLADAFRKSAAAGGAKG